MRNKTFRIVKSRLTPKALATEVLAPAPGQGDEPGHATALRAVACLASLSRMQAATWTGWGGGRNLPCAVPAFDPFDPHPSLSCRPRRARGSTRRQACWVHRTQARPAAAPARGKGQFLPADSPTTGSATGAYLWANCRTVGLFRCGAN